MSNPNVNLSTLDSRYKLSFRLKNFGAKGDGTTDDTAAVNAAVSAASAAYVSAGSVQRQSVVIHAEEGATYRLATSAATSAWLNASGSTASMAYMVGIPSGVTIDGKGSLWKFAGTSGVMFATTSCYNAGTTVVDSGLINMVIDGGNVAGTNGTSMVNFHYVMRPTLSLRVQNVVGTAIGLRSVDNGNFPYLDVDTVVGLGVGFGQYSPAGCEVRGSNFGLIRVRNVTANSANTFNFPGNPTAGIWKRCTADTIDVANCTAGVKFDHFSSDVSIGKIIIDTCGDSAGNSGLKLQGGLNTTDNVTIERVSRFNISSVVSRNQATHGLYMEYTEDCTIGQFLGISNQQLGTGPDIWFGGVRDTVKTAKSFGAGGDVVLCRQYQDQGHIGDLTARNYGQVTAASGKAAVNMPYGRLTIDNLTAIDDQSSVTALRGIYVSGTTSVLDVKKRYISGPTTSVSVVGGNTTVNLNDAVAVSGLVGPADYGAKVWSCDPMLGSSTASTATGSLYCVTTRATSAGTPSKAYFTITTAPTTATLGRFGVWDSTGTLIASSGDQSSSWSAAGDKTAITLTAIRDFVFNEVLYIGYLVVGTGSTALRATPSAASAKIGQGTSAPVYRNFTVASLTDLPATLPLGTSNIVYQSQTQVMLVV